MKYTVSTLCLAMSLLVAAVTAGGAEWEYLGADKNGIPLFYDKKNITESDGIIKIFQKQAYPEEMLQRIGERFGARYADLKKIVNLVEIDCESRSTRTSSVTYYDAKDNIIETKQGDREWTSIPYAHASASNILYELSCPAEWTHITSSKEQDYFLNARRISSSTSDVTFWMKGVDRTTSLDTEKDKFTIRCNNGTYALRYHVKYAPDGTASTVKSYERLAEWSKIGNDTIIGFFRQVLCTDGLARKDIREHLNYLTQK
ncbi:MAG: surface-adhesin E family protein [Nitrospirota bacterium]